MSVILSQLDKNCSVGTGVEKCCPKVPPPNILTSLTFPSTPTFSILPHLVFAYFTEKFLFPSKGCISLQKSVEVPHDQMTQIVTDMRFLQDVLHRLKSLRIDATEYACLKALSLFRPGKKIV